MSDRIHNILHRIYNEYYEMIQFTYYSAVKSIYYFDRVFVYELQEKILKENKESIADMYLTLIGYDKNKKCWYQYLRSPRGIDCIKFIHCSRTWRAHINKHILVLNYLKKYDPYIGFRIEPYRNWDVFTYAEKEEIVKFTKDKKKYNYSITVLYVKRIKVVKDIKYKILTYLFKKKNLPVIYRIIENKKLANHSFIESLYLQDC